MLEIIGAGLGRTGTLSLKLALEALGFGPCHHMLEVVEAPARAASWRRAAAGESVVWEDLMPGYRSTVDWPSTHFWRDLTRQYPDARVILTERDPLRWYESAHGTIYQLLKTSLPSDTPPHLAELIEMAREIIWDATFEGRFADTDYAIEVFDRHNAAVRREIPADRLLVYQVGKGWEPLCAFLNVPVPDEPFPHLNERAAFHEMFRAILTPGKM